MGVRVKMCIIKHSGQTPGTDCLFQGWAQHSQLALQHQISHPNTQASWAYLIPARRARPLVTGPLKAAKVTHHPYPCKATRLPHNNFFIVISSHQQLLPCDNTQHLTPRQRNPTKTSTYFFLSIANKELKSPQILTRGKNPLFFLK